MGTAREPRRGSLRSVLRVSRQGSPGSHSFITRKMYLPFGQDGIRVVLENFASRNVSENLPKDNRVQSIAQGIFVCHE